MSIDRGCTIKGRFIARSDYVEVKVGVEYHKDNVGAMIDEHCSIADGMTVYPGIFIGNKARTKEMKAIRDRVPDGVLVE